MDLKSYIKLFVSIIVFVFAIMITPRVFSSDDTDAKKIDPFSFQSSSYYTKGGLHLFMYGDVLYLKANEEGLEFAGIMDNPSSFFSGSSTLEPVEKTSFYSVNFNWNLGFRVGVGWHIHHDCWDLFAEWMHYDIQNRKSLHPDPATQTLLIANMNAQTGIGSPNIHMIVAQSAKEKWKLNYNILDLALAKPFWATHRLSLVPHAGLRSAWIDQNVNQTYYDISNSANAFVASLIKNKNKQEFWGLGIQAGIKTRWALSRRLSLFSDVSLSPLWAIIQLKNKELIPDAANISNPLYDVRDYYRAIKFSTDMELGAQWDLYFSHNNCHLGIRAAWEYHVWLNHNQINHFSNRTYSNSYQPMAFYKDHGNLSLYGASLGIVFDF